MSVLKKIFNKTELVPFDTSVEAEYEDGFILSETEQHDRSAYIPLEDVDGVPTGPNTLNDIVNRRPEAEHGRMVRFSVFWQGHRYDLMWDELPANARPIRLRDGSNSLNDRGEQVFNGYHACRWGYQYTDDNGKNQQFIKEL